MKKYAVAFACDNNYAMPFAVTLESMLLHRKETTFYDVFCMVPSGFSQENMQRIEKIKQKYSNFKLTFLDMKDAFQSLSMTVKHISYVTYFRLKIPELITDHDQCLYLDVDMIVKQDLSDLIGLPLGDNLVGAVVNPAFATRSKVKTYPIPAGTYFNAGMILFNSKKIREEGLSEKLYAMISEDFKCMDQDLLNVATTGRVAFVDLKYNFLIKLVTYDQEMRCRSLYGQGYDEARDTPAIIHYANREKPWAYSNVPYEKDWHDVFAQSVYADMNLTFQPYKVKKFSLLKNYLNNQKRRLFGKKVHPLTLAKFPIVE